MENNIRMWIAKAQRLADEIADLNYKLQNAHNPQVLKAHIKKLTFWEKVRLFI